MFIGMRRRIEGQSGAGQQVLLPGVAAFALYVILFDEGKRQSVCSLCSKAAGAEVKADIPRIADVSMLPAFRARWGAARTTTRAREVPACSRVRRATAGKPTSAEGPDMGLPIVPGGQSPTSCSPPKLRVRRSSVASEQFAIEIRRPPLEEEIRMPRCAGRGPLAPAAGWAVDAGRGSAARHRGVVRGSENGLEGKTKELEKLILWSE